jgi:uroporphyrinogen-III synthase
MILITRPKNESLILAKELDSKNLKTYIEPLVSFDYYPKKINFNSKKKFVVSSLQAAHVLNINKDKYKDIIINGNFLVVGNKVYLKLKEIGVQKIIKHFKTSDHLLKYLLKLKKTNLDITYLCGSIVNQDFINLLKYNKIKFQKKILYKILPIKQLTDRCFYLIKKNKIDAVLLYSTYTANLFIRLIKKHNLEPELERMHILCLSKRISLEFKNTSMEKNVLYSRSPDQESLISLVVKKCSEFKH